VTPTGQVTDALVQHARCGFHGFAPVNSKQDVTQPIIGVSDGTANKILRIGFKRTELDAFLICRETIVIRAREIDAIFDKLVMNCDTCDKKSEGRSVRRMEHVDPEMKLEVLVGPGTAEWVVHDNIVHAVQVRYRKRLRKAYTTLNNGRTTLNHVLDVLIVVKQRGANGNVATERRDTKARPHND